MTYLCLVVTEEHVTAAAYDASGCVGRSTAGAWVTPRDLWDYAEAAVTAVDDLVAVEAVGVAGPGDAHVLLTGEGEPLSVVPAASGRTLRERLAECDLSRVGWVVGARDFLASLLTGRLATDPTTASATGFFGPDGRLSHGGLGPVDPSWLPPQRGSTEVLGDLLLPAARRLGLRSRIPVVTGATTEACAVEGMGALPVAPLVTPVDGGFRVSVPVEPPAPSPPPGVALLAGGRSYQVYDAVVASAADVAALVARLAPDAKFLYAGAASDGRWPVEVATFTGLPVAHRRFATPDVGLAMLVATGVGQHLDRDVINEVSYVDEPDPGRAAALR